MLQQSRCRIEATLAKVEKIETALETHSQWLFVSALAMPNKVDAFPELAKAVMLPERTALRRERMGLAGGGVDNVCYMPYIPLDEIRQHSLES